MNAGITREELWKKQNLSERELNYDLLEHHKIRFSEISALEKNCMFIVDVCKCRYAYASSGFADLLGYDRKKVETIEEQGDYLESRIHPDDLHQMKALQVKLGHFIYSLPVSERMYYRNIYDFRVRDVRNQYIRVISRQQVLEKTDQDKAWLIWGIMDIAPDQRVKQNVGCTVLNLKNGNFFSPLQEFDVNIKLTSREKDVLFLVKEGLFSKEIADRLSVSVHTVNIHRQNILRKMKCGNFPEAICRAWESGLF